MRDNKLTLKLSLIYIVLYGAIACFNPYLILYFQQKGLSYTQIGIAFAVMWTTGVITQPIWGYVTDKYSSKRTTLLIMSVVSSVLIFNFIFAGSFFYIILSIFLIASFQNSIIPVADAYTYEIINHHKSIQYGRIRLMGSFGFAVVALILGQVIKIYGINISYFIYFAVMLVGTALIYSVNFRSKSSQHKISIKDGIELLKDNRFSVFLFSVFFANIALGTNGSYITILIQKTGGDVSKLGLLWFIMAMSELPFLFFGRRILSKFGELNLYILGTVFMALRFFLDAVSTSYNHVLAVQLMQGISFAFYFIAALQYLNNIAPAKMKTSAMTFFAAVCGMGSLTGNVGGGMLLEHISIFMLFKVISVISLVSLCVVVILKKIDKKEISRRSRMETRREINREICDSNQRLIKRLIEETNN